VKRRPVKVGRLLVGGVLTVAGGILMSPADEIAVAAATAGVGLAAAPVQGPVTAGLGAVLATAGVGLIVSAV
jgi:hypothetical protein